MKRGVKMKKLLFLTVTVLFLIMVFPLNSFAAEDDSVKITVTKSGNGGWLDVTKLIDMKKLNETGNATITILNSGEEGVEFFFSVRNSSWEYMNQLQTKETVYIEEGETIEYEFIFDEEDEVDEVVQGPAKIVLLEMRNLVEDTQIVIKGNKDIVYKKNLVGGQLCDSSYSGGQVTIDGAIFGISETPEEPDNTDTEVNVTPTPTPTEKPTPVATATVAPNSEASKATPTFDLTYTIKPYPNSDVNNNDTDTASDFLPWAIIIASISLVVTAIFVYLTVIAIKKKK